MRIRKKSTIFLKNVSYRPQPFLALGIMVRHLKGEDNDKVTISRLVRSCGNRKR